MIGKKNPISSGLSKAFQVVTATGHVTRRHSKEYYIATGEGEYHSEDEDSNLLQFMQLYFGEQVMSMLNRFDVTDMY